MKIMTIIGTRPQYIKIKPLYDYFKKSGIEHILVDTCQHYSDNVSSVFLQEFNLSLDCKLDIRNSSPIEFISECITKTARVIKRYDPEFVLVLGDTNSTLAAAIAAKKVGVNLAHVEAGVRCGDRSRPEEINRIAVDALSDIHFTPREKDNKNVSNPVWAGDLEYSLLYRMEEDGNIGDIDYQDFVLMTIHRDENTSVKRLKEIFKLCGKINRPIIFPIHHRTKKIIEENNIKVPLNIELIRPQNYKEIISLLRTCSYVISDSGGIIKISPYFGKKCLIPLAVTEWDEVIEKGYSKYFNEQTDMIFIWSKLLPRNRDLYRRNTCQIITDTLLNYE